MCQAWQELFAFKLGMNRCGHRIIRDGSRRGFHMRNEQRQMSFAAFGQVHFVANPRRASLLAVMSLLIIGRADVARWGRNILRRTPTNDVINALIILHPHLSQEFYRRNLVEPLRSGWIKQSVKQLPSLPSDQIAQKLPFELPPKASANLHYEDHSAPPILVGYGHAATLEQQSQGCPVLRASFPTRRALG